MSNLGWQRSAGLTSAAFLLERMIVSNIHHPQRSRFGLQGVKSTLDVQQDTVYRIPFQPASWRWNTRIPTLRAAQLQCLAARPKRKRWLWLRLRGPVGRSSRAARTAVTDTKLV